MECADNENRFRETLTRLTETHRAQLTRFATRLLSGNTVAAQDIVQDAFIRLWQNRANLAHAQNLPAYLLRTVQNGCRDRLRKQHRETNPSNTALEAADSTPTPDALLQAKHLADAVRVAVLSLPEEQRTVFLLSEYENMRYAEIATLLDCPPGTVASRKHKAIETLRRKLILWREK